jgi:hypothetical protein
MGDDKKPDHLKAVSGGSPEDIENLRKVAELKVQRRVVAVNMSVLRKPPDNGYFQCHPDPAQRIDASLLFDKEEGDVYFVWPHMMNHNLILPRLRRVTLATVYLWPSGRTALWPVPFPDEKGRIKPWKSARRAFEISCGLATDLDPPGPRWVQIGWNDTARDYDVVTADDLKALGRLPFGNEPDTAVESYSAVAELNCSEAHGVSMPANPLCTYAETSALINGLEIDGLTEKRPSLLEACELYQIPHMDKAEKDAARDLVIHKEIADYTFAEWDWIERYNEVDTKTDIALFMAEAPAINLPAALFRGRYSKAVVGIEATARRHRLSQ